jgi:hypothetical protein
MTPADHAAFTAALLARLSEDPDVLGLVTLGSSSGLAPLPDAFSDHDFFVVTRAGAQERFRQDLSWMPDAGAIVLAFRETAHGLKALYASGHLAEFAVFDRDELALARVNRYAVPLDRADVAARLAATRAATVAATAAAPDPRFHGGMFVTSLVVGVGRAARGELLSGHQLVRVAALGHLVTMLHARHRGDGGPLDDLDPHRRLERALPRAGAALARALMLPIPDAARALLEIADEELPGLVAPRARAAVEAVIARAES